MRCLVTGASGMVGARLVDGLLDRGSEVTVLLRPGGDRGRLAAALGRVHVLEGDLARIELSRAAIAAAAPEAVFHLGWDGVAAARRRDPGPVAGNVRGTLALLEASAGAGCRCFVGIGSQAEYGPRHGLLREDMPVRPDTPYGVGKLCAGLAAQQMAAAYGVRFLWLRLFAAYGPADATDSLIPYVVTTLLAGGKPSLTAGEQRWDYLYVDDAVDAMCEAALGKDASGILNLASGEAPTVRAIAEQIRDLIDPALPLGLGERSHPAGPPSHLEGDISRLVAATGWRPRTSLREGLARTIDWHRGRAAPAPPPAEAAEAAEGRAR